MSTSEVPQDGAAEQEKETYRVLSYAGPGMMVSVHLRPEGWNGPDLYLLGTLADVQERYPLNSIQVITREQRQRWSGGR